MIKSCPECGCSVEARLVPSSDGLSAFPHLYQVRKGPEHAVGCKHYIAPIQVEPDAIAELCAAIADAGLTVTLYGKPTTAEEIRQVATKRADERIKSILAPNQCVVCKKSGANVERGDGWIYVMGLPQAGSRVCSQACLDKLLKQLGMK